jgi:hypothetical protein
MSGVGILRFYIISGMLTFNIASGAGILGSYFVLGVDMLKNTKQPIEQKPYPNPEVGRTLTARAQRVLKHGVRLWYLIEVCNVLISVKISLK